MLVFYKFKNKFFLLVFFSYMALRVFVITFSIDIFFINIFVYICLFFNQKIKDMTTQQKINFLKNEIKLYQNEPCNNTLTKIYKYNEISMMRDRIKKFEIQLKNNN